MKGVNESAALYVQRVANTLGVTHEQLGEMVHRSQAAISQIVSGQRKEVDPLIIRRLTELLSSYVALRDLSHCVVSTKLDYCDFVDKTDDLQEIAAHIPVCAQCMTKVMSEFM